METAVGMKIRREFTEFQGSGRKLYSLGAELDDCSEG
jgi:hypothetical protein